MGRLEHLPGIERMKVRIVVAQSLCGRLKNLGNRLGRAIIGQPTNRSREGNQTPIPASPWRGRASRKQDPWAFDLRPQVQLFSGGVDSTYSIMQHRASDADGFVATVCGVDRTEDENFARLIDKTEPLLMHLNQSRITIRTNVKREPTTITRGLTLASCLFLLSDLFEHGTLAADSTHAEGMLWFPWGSNRVTNAYFVGSNFSVRTVGAEATRTKNIEDNRSRNRSSVVVLLQKTRRHSRQLRDVPKVRANQSHVSRGDRRHTTDLQRQLLR